MKNAIDLNQNQDPMMTELSGPPTPSAPSYPSVTLHGPKSHKMPKHGTAKVKYHVVEKKSTTHKGKTHHSAVVNLHSFAPMGSSMAPTDDEAIESALQEQQEGGEQGGN